jgi:hypothetical protein
VARIVEKRLPVIVRQSIITNILIGLNSDPKIAAKGPTRAPAE